MTREQKSIAIAGNIGAGKSSLVEFLNQTYGIAPFFEPNDENPYLPDFYADMKRWAFHSQLYFLSTKFNIHQQMDRTPGVVVQDRTIFEDAEIFATALHEMRQIDKRDWDTYWNFYRTILDAIRPRSHDLSALLDQDTAQAHQPEGTQNGTGHSPRLPQAPGSII